jgi:glutathione S-transferase
MNTLVTIPFSHFCEKARWALDWSGVAYRELPCLPGMHPRHTRRVGGRTAPVLLPAQGPAITDSTDILRWADAQASLGGRRLFPVEAAARAEVERLENDFDERLGPVTRLWAYAHGVTRPPLLHATVAPSLPRRRERLALRLLLPFVGPLLVKQYGATLDNVRAAEDTIRRLFDEVSALLAGRRYLVGDRFSAADLTFAALGGPMLMPREHPSLASDVELPAHLRTVVKLLQATPAGQHAARMYREHRPVRHAEPGGGGCGGGSAGAR